MSVAELIIRLVIVAWLFSYFIRRHHQRLRQWVSEPEDAAIWTGKGIDVSRLMPTLSRLRVDHIAGRKSPLKDIRHRQGLIELRRQAVARLSFFQKREFDENENEHAS